MNEMDPRQEVIARAFNAFRAQLLSAGIMYHDLVLKLGMTSLSGEIAWTSFNPEQWTKIIRDGDEIRVGRRGIKEAVICVPTPIVVFVYKYHYEEYRPATVLLPKTYKVSGL